MEQVHKSRIDCVIKPAVETLVYRSRKKKSMSFGEKIRLVYENCEVVRYKVGRMEEYLGIERVPFSSTREEEKEEEENFFARDIFLTNLRRFSDVLISAPKVLTLSLLFCEGNICRLK